MKDSLVLWISGWLAVRTDDPEQRRRGQVLGILLLGVLATTLALTLVNASDSLLVRLRPRRLFIYRLTWSLLRFSRACCI